LIVSLPIRHPQDKESQRTPGTWRVCGAVNEELKFLEFISARLGAVGIPYMLTGSMAMMFYAVPRMTRDVDLVIECPAEDLNKLLEAFAGDCYISEEAVQYAVSHQGMFNIIHLEWSMKADFIVRKASEYRVLEFSRRRIHALEEFEITVVAPEDLILSKLDWAQDSHSESQYRDVSMMLATVLQLDFGYLEQWADHLGVLPKLNELRPQ
jgi:hypothetical protein